MNKLAALVLSGCLFLASCSPYSTYQDILEIPDILQRKCDGKLATYKVVYQPLWLKHLRTARELKKPDTYASLKKTYGNHLNFVLDVTLPDAKNELKLTGEYISNNLRILAEETEYRLSFIQEEQAGILNNKRFLISCELPDDNNRIENDINIELVIEAESSAPFLFTYSKQELNNINLVNG